MELPPVKRKGEDKEIASIDHSSCESDSQGIPYNFQVTTLTWGSGLTPVSVTMARCGIPHTWCLSGGLGAPASAEKETLFFAPPFPGSEATCFHCLVASRPMALFPASSTIIPPSLMTLLPPCGKNPCGHT